ncbi:hypothetical protein GCM10010922_11030 [Microbacterium sorbitolivorans]|uniref:FAD-binding domain-containing protein n=1 Tax=Microbacterium sorbitolivorans TaxID=1867410 RepID=A0A367XY68_9MICO|nr:FAD-dependent monooxygenase [Microbacterium sorbitolivorans]RCK58567.1 hypothetical protein DTO57_10435 [Microbacterium sorbitolivorans]GGF37551.1 hypothetical protein GCM10010922_11030 [Microbacterium sorbitolivorans]
MQTRLSLPDEAMGYSRDVLRDYGNMSCATILFILRRIERASESGIRRVLLRRLRRSRVFVIGDAAHEISPIGGQGMNLGLLDAATLAPALAHWLREPTDLRPVDRWERDRLASARTAANLAGMNTAIGQARGVAGHAAAMAAVRAAAATPLARFAAHAHGMGLDRSVS